MNKSPYFSKFDYSVPLQIFLFCFETIGIILVGAVGIVARTRYELKRDWKEIRGLGR